MGRPKKDKTITADTDAAGTASAAARKRADAAFKKTQKAEADAAQAKAAGEALKATITTMALPELRDVKHHMQTIAGWKSKLDEANGHLRNAWKAAEEAGIDVAALKASFKWSKRDPVEVVRFLLSFNQQMKLQGSEVQLQILDESALDLDEKALQDGYRAGLAGRHDNPHDLGTIAHNKYEDGYARGQGELLGVANADQRRTEGGGDLLEERPNLLPSEQAEAAEAERLSGKLDQIAKVDGEEPAMTEYLDQIQRGPREAALAH